MFFSVDAGRDGRFPCRRTNAKACTCYFSCAKKKKYFCLCVVNIWIFSRKFVHSRNTNAPNTAHIDARVNFVRCLLLCGRFRVFGASERPCNRRLLPPLPWLTVPSPRRRPPRRRRRKRRGKAENTEIRSAIQVLSNHREVSVKGAAAAMVAF